jgi:hypothetical protein
MKTGGQLPCIIWEREMAGTSAKVRDRNMNKLNTTGSVSAEGKEKKNNRNVFARKKRTNGVGKKINTL